MYYTMILIQCYYLVSTGHRQSLRGSGALQRKAWTWLQLSSSSQPRHIFPNMVSVKNHDWHNPKFEFKFFRIWGDLALPVKFKFLPNFEFLLHLKFVTPLIIFQVSSQYFWLILEQYFPSFQSRGASTFKV